MNKQKGRQKKISEYGQQLIEKQKTKRAYGMRETQFKRYFTEASKFRGQAGEMLLQMLERRIDNVLYRAGFAKTRKQARQLAGHRHITLNGVRISIPSIIVKQKDVIAPYKGSLEYQPESPEVDWLKVDKKTGKITVLRLPEKEDLPIEFDTKKIIEFYSR